MNCIVCDRSIEIIGTEPSIPATFFDTSGNYGSTIIDNIKPDEPKIIIIICDECLNRKKEFLYSQFRKNQKKFKELEMSIEEKQKLFLSRINNLHSEYEALINDIAKDFRTEVLIPFCDCYGIDFVFRKHDFLFLKEGVEIFDHDKLCYNKIFEDEWRKVNNILTSYVGIEGDYVLGNFVDSYTHNIPNE